MNNDTENPLNQLENEILQKQKEITNLTGQKFLNLQGILQQKEEALAAAKEKWKALKEDFEYNLKLLEGRDEELKRYEAAFLKVKHILEEKFGLLHF